MFFGHDTKQVGNWKLDTLSMKDVMLFLLKKFWVNECFTSIYTTLI